MLVVVLDLLIISSIYVFSCEMILGRFNLHNNIIKQDQWATTKCTHHMVHRRGYNTMMENPRERERKYYYAGKKKTKHKLTNKIVDSLVRMRFRRTKAKSDLFGAVNERLPITHAYIHNWHLQSFSQDYGLASHTSYFVCFNFIRKWRDVQFNVNPERQIFVKLFHGRFIY